MKLPDLDQLGKSAAPKKLAGIIMAARKGQKSATAKKINLKFGNLGK